jgi:hypothetical protein
MRIVLTLSNGKRVANFSSPHRFLFEDGSVLLPVSIEESKRLSMIVEENQLNDRGDTTIEHSLPDAIEIEMQYWKELHKQGKVDVVFCPYPMIRAIWTNVRNNMADDSEVEKYMLSMPFRSVCTVNRLTKASSITKQYL